MGVIVRWVARTPLYSVAGVMVRSVCVSGARAASLTSSHARAPNLFGFGFSCGFCALPFGANLYSCSASLTPCY